MKKVFMYESVDDYCIQMNYRFRLYSSLLPKCILFLFCSCDRHSEIQTCHKNLCLLHASVVDKREKITQLLNYRCDRTKTRDPENNMYILK